MKDIDYSMFYTRDAKTGLYTQAEGFTHFRVRHFAKGEPLARKGVLANELLIVVEGSVIVEFVIDSGLVIRSTQHDAPTLIGALAILTHDGRHRADTIAHTDVVALSFSRSQIEQRMQSSLTFMYNFITFIGSRVEILSTHIAILAQKNINAKLAFYIFLCSDGQHYRFDKPIGKLATHIAVDRSSLSRAISALVEQGIITYRNGEGDIRDELRLKSFL